MQHDKTPPWANMFPLPLTPFERYLLADDRPQCPMMIMMYFVFRGHIQRDLFEEAFRQAISYEPAFWARIASRGGKDVWELDLENPPPLFFRTLEQNPSGSREGSFIIPDLDMRKVPGAAFWVEEAPDEVRISFLVHHLLGDGRAMMDFIGLWLAAYERLVNPQTEVELCAPNPELFAIREKLFIELPEKVPLWQSASFTLKESVKWFYRRPWVLRGDEPVEGEAAKDTPAEPFSAQRAAEGWHPELTPQGAPGPTIYWRVVDNDFRIRYLQAAKKHGVAVNSLFMRDLYLAIGRWREHLLEKGLITARRNSWFRILMPGDLRNAHHEDMPSTNLIGYTFFDFLPGECNRGEAFLGRIQEMTTLTQQWSGGAMFLEGLKLFCGIPLALNWVTSPRRCHSTSVLSNMGICCRFLRNPYFRQIRNFKVTGLEMIRCQGMPPIRENMPVSVGVVTHGEDMVFSVAVDHRVFTPEAGERFKAEYFRQLEETAGKE